MCVYCDPKRLEYGHQKNIISKELSAGVLGHFSMYASLILLTTGQVELCMTLESETEGVGDYSTATINYCPMCGRKLREEEE